jgi:hypothetical protein
MASPTVAGYVITPSNPAAGKGLSVSTYAEATLPRSRYLREDLSQVGLCSSATATADTAKLWIKGIGRFICHDQFQR